MKKTLYMVVEHFKNNDPVPVYRRFHARGRLAPKGLVHISSWIDHNLERCYQLMETHDRTLLEEWMTRWWDLVEFEVYPVVTSQEASDMVAPLLQNSAQRIDLFAYENVTEQLPQLYDSPASPTLPSRLDGPRIQTSQDTKRESV
jgi:hypothetical protein